MRKFILPISIVFILLASGCTSLDPTSLVKATPAVSKFLEDYPNAEVKAVHYTVEESASIVDDIMADCEKEAVTPKEYYKVTITDAESDLDVIAWVDVKAQVVECVVKRGSTGDDDDETKPSYRECTAEQKNATICTMDYSPVCAQVDTGIRCITTPCPSTEWKTFSNACVACSTDNVLGWKQGECGEVCQSKYKAKCDAGHVYWYDSCGNIEGKKEYCPLGCSNDACVKDEKVCEVEKNYMEKPACNCPAGYNMIVVYPRCESTASQTASTEEAPVASTTSGGGSGNSDGISGQITGMPIAQAVQTQEGKVQIAEEYTTEATERCSGGQPFYRCVKNTECKPHAKAACYGNHVYWFDSCGNAQEKKEYCENGCSNGACVTNGYRNAYWECYDGNEYSEGGETSCKSSDTWRQYAEKSCEGRCTNTAATTAIKPKCGVSSFSVKNECDGLNECSGICPMYATVAPGWCEDGTIVSGGKDKCGCELPPQCVKEADVCCESYGYGSQMVECCQTYAWTAAGQCATPEGLVGGGKRIVDDEYCSAGCSSDDECMELACPGGGYVHAVCEKGKCVLNAACPNTCTDSDGGYNAYEAGTATASGQSLSDHCNDDGTLTEKYCSGSEIMANSAIYCPAGYACEDGACKSTAGNTCARVAVVEGSSTTVTENGQSYVVTVVGVGENNDAVIDINGEQFDVDTDSGGVVDITKDDLSLQVEFIRAMKFPVETAVVQFEYDCDTENSLDFSYEGFNEVFVPVAATLKATESNGEPQFVLKLRAVNDLEDYEIRGEGNAGRRIRFVDGQWQDASCTNVKATKTRFTNPELGRVIYNTEARDCNFDLEDGVEYTFDVDFYYYDAAGQMQIESGAVTVKASS